MTGSQKEPRCFQCGREAPPTLPLPLEDLGDMVRGQRICSDGQREGSSPGQEGRQPGCRPRALQVPRGDAPCSPFSRLLQREMTWDRHAAGGSNAETPRAISSRTAPCKATAQRHGQELKWTSRTLPAGFPICYPLAASSAGFRQPCALGIDHREASAGCPASRQPQSSNPTEHPFHLLPAVLYLELGQEWRPSILCSIMAPLCVFSSFLLVAE